MKLNITEKRKVPPSVFHLSVPRRNYQFLSLLEFSINKMGIFQTEPKKQVSRGGNRAVLFVYATEGLENMAWIANAMSLVTYFSGFMNFSMTKSATTLTNFLGTAFLLPLFAGYISDTYWSRFKTCLIFALIELVGYGLLTAQAHYPQLRPTPCKLDVAEPHCEGADTGQLALLYTGLYLIALGTSGVKAALPALGADQFDDKDPKQARQMSSFFNWFFLSLTIGAIFGVTFVIWISANHGWDLAFGISTLAVLFSVLSLCMGKSFYRNKKINPKGSPLISILQVLVASIRNRKIPIPEKAENLHEINDKEAGEEHEYLQRTEQFRFLDRAAISNHTIEVSSRSSNPGGGAWSLCTVTQVEQVKLLIRMLPIVLSTVFMNTCLGVVQTFSVNQSTTLDRQIGTFKIPAASIPIFPLLVMFFLIPLYDRVLVPLLRKLTGIPTGIRHLQRIAVGLVLTAISMAIAGIIETRRKSVAVKHNMVDSTEPLPMSVFWLGIQYAIFGAADMFTVVGLLEFFYAESAAGMKSLGTAISWCPIAFGYFLSSVMVETVNKVSGGWLGSNNLNRNKLNYFYWLLSGMSLINFGVYCLCAYWYKYKKVEVVVLEKEGDSNGSVQMIKA